MHPRIEKARAGMADATLKLHGALLSVQASCLHEKVAELQASRLFAAWHNSRRLCLTCGYEEENRRWGWPGAIETYLDGTGPAKYDREGEPTRLNTKFTQVVGYDEFFKLRP